MTEIYAPDLPAMKALYEAKDWNGLEGKFLEAFVRLQGGSQGVPFRLTTEGADALLTVFFRMFALPEFPVSNWRLWMTIGPTIVNLAYLSSYGSTDILAHMLLSAKDVDVTKLLVIYSPYSGVDIDLDDLLAVDEERFGFWLSTALECSIQWCRKGYHEKFLKLLDMVRKVPFGEKLMQPYFYVSYLDPGREIEVRRAVIGSLLKARANIRPKAGKSDPGNIAIVTGRWFGNNVVYRCLFDYVAALKYAGYRLTLLNHSGTAPDDQLFDEVWNCDFRNPESSDLKKLANSTFGGAVLLDVGMDIPSICFAAGRIAPVQIAMYGHPVTTASRNVDYFLCGDLTEDRLPNRRYTEKVALMRGLGTSWVDPLLPEVRAFVSDEEIRIAVPWSRQKMNERMLTFLADVSKRFDRPARFVFFPGSSRHKLIGAALDRILQEYYGKSFEMHDGLKMPEYMAALDTCHFGVEALPFGSFQSALDCIALGKPFVSISGDRAYNRLNQGLLKGLGLEELVTFDMEAYADLIVRMVNDADYRKEITEKTASITLEERRERLSRPDEFVRTITRLVGKPTCTTSKLLNACSTN